MDAGDAASGGRLDAIALGEWVHGGDVRDALGQPLAYASAGFGDACALLADFTRSRRVPLIEATLGYLTVRLGVRLPGRPVATLVTDNAMLMRLFAVGQRRLRLPAGRAEPEELIVF